jgi:hypothetical protein
MGIMEREPFGRENGTMAIGIAWTIWLLLYGKAQVIPVDVVWELLHGC